MESMTKTVRLSRPVNYGGQDHDELVMRESTLGDEEDALQMAVNMGRKDNALTISMCLFATLCRVPYDALRGLRNVDNEALQAAYTALNRPEKADPTTAQDGTTQPSS